MASVTIRYWAAAKEAAGTAEETLQAETLGAALAAATARRSGTRGRFASVLACSSLLVDGQQAGHRAAESFTLWDSAVIEVLPPFAGG
jgi:sulfur-carrier protein